MSTPAPAPATRYPETGRYTSAAELYTAIMRAADELPAMPADWAAAGFTWADLARRGMIPPGPDGKEPAARRLIFAYQLTGSAGSLSIVAQSRCRVLELADTVRRQWSAFGGGPKPAELIKPRAAAPARKPRGAGNISAGIAAARAILDRGFVGDAADALQSLGSAVFVGNPGPGPGAVGMLYCEAQRHEIGGARWVIARQVKAPRWVILAEGSALSLTRRRPGDQHAEFRSAADALSTLAQWLSEDDDAGYARRTIVAAVDKARPFDQAAALATLPREDAPPAAAAAEPIADGAAPSSAPETAAPAVSADPAPADPRAAELAAACLQRFGVSDLDACRHLPAFADWHAAALASIGAPGPVPGPARPPAAARPAAPGGAAAPTSPRAVAVSTAHPPCGSGEQCAPDSRIPWQILAARPETIYATAPRRIGVHEWACVVYRHAAYGMCTDYVWRRVDQNRGAFRRADDWPTYDGNDSDSGMPRTLRKLYAENVDAIRIALSAPTTGAPPPSGSDDAGPATPPGSGDACAPPAVDRQAFDRAVSLAQSIVETIGDDLAELAPALRRESARVSAAAVGMPATIAESYRKTAIMLAEHADDIEADAAACADDVRDRFGEPAPAPSSGPVVAAALVRLRAGAGCPPAPRNPVRAGLQRRQVALPGRFGVAVRRPQRYARAGPAVPRRAAPAATAAARSPPPGG